MLLTAHVSTDNSLDLRSDRTYGLQSLLYGLSYKDSTSLVRNLDNALNNSNLFSYIFLSSFFSVPSISIISTYICNKLEFIEDSDLKNLLYRFSPEYTSGLGDVLSILSVPSFDQETKLYEYFNYLPFDYTHIIEEPSSYYTWLVEQEPTLQRTVDFLINGDVPNLLCQIVLLQTKFDIRTNPSLWNILNYWSFISFSPFVIGHDYNQVFR